MNFTAGVSCCLAAAVCGASAAGAGGFLEGLAARTDRVDSSPHATGGDIILCLSQERGEYVHVFTNVAQAGVFAPTKSLRARILVVGGGGAGGSGFCGHGGGGGAGGLLERFDVRLDANVDYPATIGKGGDSVTGNDNQPGNSGGATSFADLTALGGGGGGAFVSRTSGGNNDGRSGGSGGGGGGSQNYAGQGGAGDPEQGHAGGNGMAYSATGGSMSGGGGGAGGRGGDCHIATISHRSSSDGGDGGTGRLSTILGETRMFAGGGGGGNYGHGGPGGGGAGGRTFDSAHINAYPGEDGLGGGGGGVVCESNGAVSGRGGNGVVIVRYFASDEASIVAVSSSVKRAESGAAIFSVACRDYELQAPAVSAVLEVWPAADPSSVVRQAVENMSVTNTADFVVSMSVVDLTARAQYEYRFTLTNASGATTAATGTFTMFAPTCEPVVAGLDAADYVVKHAVDETDEIYIFTNAMKTATFTPQFDGYVRLLVVGGGGAGYGAGKGGDIAGGGGGGGGGVVYQPSYYVEGGTPYAVKVGAGATANGGTFWTAQAENGEDSSFGEVIAAGGGSGGGRDTWNGRLGGSGGGGSDKLAGGGGIRGQGHAGGTNSADNRGCGGGGAGSVGGVPPADGLTAANGGDGIGYDISGILTTYGGGGAAGIGGSYGQGLGGAGGGGNGCTSSLPAEKGVDGLGGGGGGGNGGGGSCKFGAASGGSGVVIVRFTDVSKLSVDPKFSVTFSDVTRETIDADVSVSYFGPGCEAVTVTAIWGYSADALVFSKVLASSHRESKKYTVDGLNPGRDYVMQIVVSNEKGGEAVSENHIFATEAGIRPTLSFSHEIYTYRLAYNVDSLGTGALTATLWTGSEDGIVAAESVDVTETGAFAFTHAYSEDLRTSNVFAYVELVSAEGGICWTSRTDTVEFTVDDNSVYTFSAADGAGDWEDSASWTGNYGAGGLGWPGGAATATFPKNVASEVRLAKSEHPGSLDLLSVTGASITLKGLADGIEVSPVNGKGDYFVGAGTTLVLDHLTLDMKPGGASPKFSQNQRMVLRNGATFSYVQGVLEMEKETGGVLSVESGSSVTLNGLWCKCGSAVTVDDAVLTCVINYGVDLGYKGNGSEVTHLTVAGANARISSTGMCSSEGPAEILFDIPERPWTVAPIRVTGAFAGAGRAITVNLPEKKLIKVKCGARTDIPLVTAGGGIKAANVVFGSNPLEYRGGRFFIGDDGKTLFYHYEPGQGMVMFVR